MTSTQRSEGMNNVFKKRFRRKLCLSELIEECEKCVVSLHENELDADYKSKYSKPIIYIPHLAMLKTTAETYTRRLYLEFEEQFREQFSFTCQLLESEGPIRTYKVIPSRFQDEATIVFNSEVLTITCSCRKYECIGMYCISNQYSFTVHIAQTQCIYIAGMLCKHALRVFNINEVFILPAEYILNRWTQYAKREFYCEKAQINPNETSKTQVAHISQKATSIALKCSVSKEILDDLERSIDKLDLESDDSLSQRATTHCELPQSCNVHDSHILKGKVSIIAAQVLNGSKNKIAKSVLEKKQGKKKKSAGKKGATDVGQGQKELIVR
jgi:hypothetical protein